MSEATQSVGKDSERELLDASVGGIILFAILLMAFAVFSARMDGAGPQTPKNWLDAVHQNLAGRGFDWIRITIVDGVATVSGEAPDVDSRQFGFEAAAKAIDNADREDTVKFMVDATHMEGAPKSAGAALGGLGAMPTAAECDAAFAETLEGRSITFGSASSTLDDDAHRLLDALAGVALRCKTHHITVRGHTDRRGRAGVNQAVSQARAEAVRQYLVDRGVAAEGLKTEGLGATQRLDRKRTAAADARNRRVDFIIKQR